jgi:hypothetical protein
MASRIVKTRSGPAYSENRVREIVELIIVTAYAISSSVYLVKCHDKERAGESRNDEPPLPIEVYIG